MRWLLLACLAACTEDAPSSPGDPCEPLPLVEGGATSIGLGIDAAPIADGQDVYVEFGLQGLWMFVVNTRAYDMEVGAGAREGIVEFRARDLDGTLLSLETGCRVREFHDDGDGSLLSTEFWLPLAPQHNNMLDGTPMRIEVEVRDREGRRAIDERMVIARKP